MKRQRKHKVDAVVSAKLLSKSKEEIPIIVSFKSGTTQAISDVATSMSTKVKYNLPRFGGIACNMTIDAIDKLSKDPNIDYISFDSKVFALLDIANASVASNFPHNEGYKGKDVTVAVIDTGVAPHADLVTPENRIVGFKDFVNDKEDPYDDNGHGTHVAGIIASNGASSNGKYAGVAPEANIVAVKALDDAGSGNTSDIISAIEWVIETKDVYDTKILNLSLGSPVNNPYTSDPLAQAAEEAVRAGLTVVVAAGNSGPSKETILCPGNSPSVITVGALDDNKTPEIDDDSIASFSSRGPTKEGLKKPDVVAPGVDIMSLSNKSLNKYVSLSGTSMATPVVSGASALLYEKEKKLTPRQVKSMMKKSCIEISEKQDAQGAGIINLESLFKSRVSDDAPPNKISGPSSLFNDGFVILIVLVLLLLFSHDI